MIGFYLIVVFMLQTGIPSMKSVHLFADQDECSRAGQALLEEVIEDKTIRRGVWLCMPVELDSSVQSHAQ